MSGTLTTLQRIIATSHSPSEQTRNGSTQESSSLPDRQLHLLFATQNLATILLTPEHPLSLHTWSKKLNFSHTLAKWLRAKHYRIFTKASEFPYTFSRQNSVHAFKNPSAGQLKHKGKHFDSPKDLWRMHPPSHKSARLREQSLTWHLGHMQETMPSLLLFPALLILCAVLPLGSELLIPNGSREPAWQLCPDVEQSRGRGDAVYSPSTQPIKSVLFYKINMPDTIFFLAFNIDLRSNNSSSRAFKVYHTTVILISLTLLMKLNCFPWRINLLGVILISFVLLYSIASSRELLYTRHQNKPLSIHSKHGARGTTGVPKCLGIQPDVLWEPFSSLNFCIVQLLLT